MSIAGHVSIEMLRHYSHIRREAKRKAVASCDRTIYGTMPLPSGRNRQKPANKPSCPSPGNVSREMLEHYSHVRQQAKRKAVESLDNVTITAQLGKWETWGEPTQ